MVVTYNVREEFAGHKFSSDAPAYALDEDLTCILGITVKFMLPN